MKNISLQKGKRRCERSNSDKHIQTHTRYTTPTPPPTPHTPPPTPHPHLLRKNEENPFPFQDEEACVQSAAKKQREPSRRTDQFQITVYVLTHDKKKVQIWLSGFYLYSGLTYFGSLRPIAIRAVGCFDQLGVRVAWCQGWWSLFCCCACVVRKVTDSQSTAVVCSPFIYYIVIFHMCLL